MNALSANEKTNWPPPKSAKDPLVTEQPQPQATTPPVFALDGGVQRGFQALCCLPCVVGQTDELLTLNKRASSCWSGCGNKECVKWSVCYAALSVAEMLAGLTSTLGGFYFPCSLSSMYFIGRQRTEIKRRNGQDPDRQDRFTDSVYSGLCCPCAAYDNVEKAYAL